MILHSLHLRVLKPGSLPHSTVGEALFGLPSSLWIISGPGQKSLQEAAVIINPWVCICVCVSVFVCVFVYVSVCVSVCICLLVFIFVPMCVFMCLSVCLCGSVGVECIFVYLREYLRVHLCLHVSMSMCVSITWGDPQRERLTCPWRSASTKFWSPVPS